MCRGMDPELFHRCADADAAIDVCRRCPVLNGCRNWILGLSNRADSADICAGLSIEE